MCERDSVFLFAIKERRIYEMINDKIENLLYYLPKSKQRKMDKFIKSIREDMEEGYYEIDGDNIYAKVMSYDGKLREFCRIEAHNNYVDIQFSIMGIEGIDIFDRSLLEVKEPYNEKEDIVFFQETKKCYLKIANLSGYFTMIFPKEAHKPQITLNLDNPFIKKCVIKVKETCFE